MKRLLMFGMVALLALVFVTSCAQNGQSIAKMTPKEKAAFAMSMYSSAFDEYKIQFESMSVDGLDAKEKDYLGGYLNVLENSYRSIKLYRNYAAAGTVATPEAEAALTAAIRELTAILAKGGK